MNIANPATSDLTGALGVSCTPAPSPYTPEQRRRKVITYFQNSTAVLRDAVFNAAPTLTIFDSERIVETFAEHIDDYSGPEIKKAFRAGFHKWAVEWISRITLLTERVKPLIPALTRLAESAPGLGVDDYQSVASRILNNLHQYPGDTTDAATFGAWAADWTVRETQATVELVGWVEKHRGIVYDGLWQILAGCKDLGADEFIADELSCNVWAWIAENVYTFLEDGAPLHLRLRALAVEFARNWRSSRIDDRDFFRSITTVETGQIKSLNQAAGVPPVRKKPFAPVEPAKVA